MKTKTKTKQKLLKLFAVFIFFTLNSDIFAQSSSTPTQSVCVNTSEPYLLNAASPTSTFQWVLNSGGAIATGQTTSSITINWGSAGGGPHVLSVTETDANGCVGAEKTVEVTLFELDDPAFTLTDYCAGSSNSASAIVTSGGSFVFNPSPSGTESINALTGEITGGVGGNSYVIEYTTTGICPAQNTETVLVNSIDDPAFTLTDYCAGSSNSASAIATLGGSFVFNPLPSGTESINTLTGEITGGLGGTSYVIEYTTIGICPAQNTETVLVNSVDDPNFTLTDYCAGSSNSASAIATSGGSFVFNPLPSGSETINALTGEITAGVGGNSYGIEHITSGSCPSTLIQNVLIFAAPSTGPIFHN